MSPWEADTDAEGKVEMQQALPASLEPGIRIRMMVVKSGYDGAQTKELELGEAKQAGSGDFGTVVLKPGHILRGKVVDDSGQGVHGAVVTNQTNYFLYGHLRCRTDADGHFAMPDLSFGTQNLSAQYGEQSGTTDFQFDADHSECVITLGLTPK